MVRVITIEDKLKKKPSCLTIDTIKKNLVSIIKKEKHNKGKVKDEQVKNSGVNSKYYRGENSEVVIALKDVYGNKCAFCESKLTKPDIEHFRPQSLSNYYWLGYEWTNLLPICDTCNDTKGEDFPITGKSARNIDFFLDDEGKLNEALLIVKSDILLAEKALLIHPELENPSSFLKFLSNGELQGIDNEGRGEKTIYTYGLNKLKVGKQREDRDIILGRKKILDDFIISLSDAFNIYVDWLDCIKADENNKHIRETRLFLRFISWFGKSPDKQELSNVRLKAKEDLRKSIYKEIEKLDKGKEKSHVYSFVYNYIWLNFEELVLSKFDVIISNDIRRIFDEYNKG